MNLVNIRRKAKANQKFRDIIYTGSNSQVVVMSLRPGEEIGEEIHANSDQILFFFDGDGIAIIDGELSSISRNDLVFVPAGTKHNFKNLGDHDMKLLTIYAPPVHRAKHKPAERRSYVIEA